MEKNSGAKAIVAAYYSKNGELYEKWAYGDGLPTPREAWLRDFMQRLQHTAAGAQINVLELGCGTGEPCTRMLLEAGINVTAVDIAPGMIELARKRLSPFLQADDGATGYARPDAEGEKHKRAAKFGSVELICGDMAALQQEHWKGRFDGIVAFYSLIHVPRDEMAALWSRIAVWLKPHPNGLILCNLSGSDVEEQRQANWLDTGDEMYWSSWDQAKHMLMLDRQAGVEILRAEDIVDEEDGVDVEFRWILARKKNS